MQNPCRGSSACREHLRPFAGREIAGRQKNARPFAARAEIFCRLRGWVVAAKGFHNIGTAFAFCRLSAALAALVKQQELSTESNMPLNVNAIFDTHAKSLALGSQRIELLAANIANADTPNYLARDIDFKGAMAEQARSVGMQRTAANHIDPARVGGGPATVLYRIPDQPAQDGNTVDAQKEKAAVAETALRYQTSLSFLNMRIRGLKLAITGGQ